MYQYRVFSEAGRIFRRAFMAACIVVGSLLALQLALVFLLIHLHHPWLSYGFLVLHVLGVVVIAYNIVRMKADNRILSARGYNLTSRASHADLKRYLGHLIHCIKRISTHRLLSNAQAQSLHHKATELEEALHHHPLNEDLIRGIATAREDVLAPAFGILDDIADRVTASKARAVVQDIFQPPFPVIAPLVVFYHQFTLVCDIADIYLTRPSLREYTRVLRDVWQVMTKGDFMRYGQRLFAGINSNTYRLGRPADDLGQVFSMVWLTHAFARAAMLRCCTLHDWKLSGAIEDMRQELPPCLEKTRALLLNDVMPIVRNRIRSYAPLDHDPVEYTDDVALNFTKAVDSVVVALNASSSHPQDAAGTSPGLVIGQVQDFEAGDAPGERESVPAAGGPVKVRVRRRSRRRSSPSRGILGILFPGLKHRSKS